MVSTMNSSQALSSLRLSRLVDLCGVGDTLWDIGCDHGLAGLLAGRSGSFKHICFVDPSSLVIEKLRDTLDSDIPKGFSFSILEERGDQIKVSHPNNVFLMAGFGGKGIIEALKAISLQLSLPNRFVLAPHRDNLAVRDFLQQADWHLVTEEIIEENEQFYEVLVVESRSGVRVSRFGEQQWQTPTGLRRCDDLLKKLSIHRNPQDQDFVKHLLNLQNSSKTP